MTSSEDPAETALISSHTVHTMTPSQILFTLQLFCELTFYRTVASRRSCLHLYGVSAEQSYNFQPRSRRHCEWYYGALADTKSAYTAFQLTRRTIYGATPTACVAHVGPRLSTLIGTMDAIHTIVCVDNSQPKTSWK